MFVMDEPHSDSPGAPGASSPAPPALCPGSGPERGVEMSHLCKADLSARTAELLTHKGHFLKWTNLFNPRSWSPGEQGVEAFSPVCAACCT